MKLRTRIILNRAIVFILGVLIIGMGLLKDKEAFLPMGIAMVICTVFQLVKQWKFLFDDNKMKELENTYNDERVIFIAQKSYSLALWVSVYAEFIGILVTMYLGMENISSVISFIVCFQVIIYVVASIFYSKKF